MKQTRKGLRKNKTANRGDSKRAAAFFVAEDLNFGKLSKILDSMTAKPFLYRHRQGAAVDKWRNINTNDRRNVENPVFMRVCAIP